MLPETFPLKTKHRAFLTGPITMMQYLPGATSGSKALFVLQLEEVQSIMVGKTWGQKLVVAAYLMSTAKKQSDDRRC